MKKLAVLFVVGVSLLLYPLKAQVWATVGNGITENPYWNSLVTSHESNGVIYVSLTDYTSVNIYTTIVKKWNGLVWQNYPSVKNFVISDIVTHNGRVYITGYPFSGPKNVAFYEFDGSNWQAHAPAGFTGETHCLASINGNLLVGGDFTTSSATSDIFSWDGSNFNSFPAFGGGQVFVKSIDEINGEIHVSGPANASAQVQGLYKWDGTNWISLASRFKGTPGPAFSNTFERMFQFQGNLYCSVLNELYKVENDTVFFVDNLNSALLDFVQIGGLMYLGDSMNLSTFDGNSVTLLGNAPSSSGLEVLNGELYSFGPRGFSQGSLFSNANAFKTSVTNGVFSGLTFFDADGDCTKDFNEYPLTSLMISVNNLHVGISNSKGKYNFLLPPGTYPFSSSVLTSPKNKNFAVTCSLPSTINILQGQVTNLPIPFSNPVANDLVLSSHSGSGWRTRQGFIETNYIHVENAGNSTQQNVMVDVELPPSIMFTGSTAPNGHSINNNTLSLNLGNIQPYDLVTVRYTISAPLPTNPVGKKLVWTSKITSPPLSMDADPLDNFDTLRTIVTAACDPNDKTPSETNIAPGTTDIDYHIRFQNTGNDTAYNIVVVDTLELNIPITSVIMNGSSHNYQLRVENNILIWEFDNILLPDSTTDLAGSQGYINFSTSINPNLAVGDTVQNQVQIYFDYQPPVFTNKAKTAVVNWIGENELLVEKSFNAYPNPANEFLYLESFTNAKTQVQLFNSEAKLIQTFDLEAFGKTEINIQELVPGLYILVNGESKYKLMVR